MDLSVFGLRTSLQSNTTLELFGYPYNLPITTHLYCPGLSGLGNLMYTLFQDLFLISQNTSSRKTPESSPSDIPGGALVVQAVGFVDGCRGNPLDT